MGLKEGQAIQFLKAAYGLTIAPREFYVFVDEVLKKLIRTWSDSPQSPVCGA